MPQTLALLHTGTFLVPVFDTLCRSVIPRVRTFDIVDESLIADTIAAGGLTPPIARRVAGHVYAAEEAGADAVLVTCSSIGPAVDAVGPFSSIPALRVDRPMADRAVDIGRRIGVAATLATTLEPTVDLIRRRAAARGIEIDVVSCVCDGAFDAVSSGDTASHDRLVAAALAELVGGVDVVVLAQASMARVAATRVDETGTVPILSSPESGVRGARDVLASLTTGERSDRTNQPGSS